MDECTLVKLHAVEAKCMGSIHEDSNELHVREGTFANLEAFVLSQIVTCFWAYLVA